MYFVFFRLMLPTAKLAEGDDGDGWGGASVEGQKETGRWRAGDNSDVKSSNVKDELAFNLMEY